MTKASWAVFSQKSASLGLVPGSAAGARSRLRVVVAVVLPGSHARLESRTCSKWRAQT